jgi:hypothetical protein
MGTKKMVQDFRGYANKAGKRLRKERRGQWVLFTCGGRELRIPARAPSTRSLKNELGLR